MVISSEEAQAADQRMRELMELHAEGGVRAL